MPLCFLPDLTHVKSGSACPPLGRCYRAHPPGQALPNFQPPVSPQPPLPCACASGNRTDRPATGRSLRRSSGPRPSWAVRATRGDRLYRHSHPPFPSACSAGNLTDRRGLDRSPRRSVGTRFSPAVRAIKRDRRQRPTCRGNDGSACPAVPGFHAIILARSPHLPAG